MTTPPKPSLDHLDEAARREAEQAQEAMRELFGYSIWSFLTSLARIAHTWTFSSGLSCDLT